MVDTQPGYNSAIAEFNDRGDAMKPTLTRLAGILLIVAAVLGLIVSLAGLILLGRAEQDFSASIANGIALLDRALGTTMEGLAVTSDSLDRAGNTITWLETTTGGFGRAITNTIPTINALSDVLGEDLPATIEATQQALASAQTSAKFLDDAVVLFNALRPSEPRTTPPLNETIAEVSASLDGIPAALVKAREGLVRTARNLRRIENNLASVTGGITEIGVGLEDAQSVIVDYQDVVKDLKNKVEVVGDRLPGWLSAARWSLSLVLIWLGIAQIGLLTQGLELIRRGRIAQ